MPLLARRCSLGRRAAATGVLALIAATSTPLPGQDAPTTDLLVLLRSNGDTVAVERTHRLPGRLEGELLLASANARFTYTVDVGADGGATRLDNAYRPASADMDSDPVQRAVVRFTRDSAIAEITGGGRTQVQRFGTRPGVIPFINPSFALLELVIDRARRIGGDSTEVPIWAVQGGTTLMASVVRRGADSVSITIGGIPIVLAVDADGKVTGGGVPSQGLQLVRERGVAEAVMRVPPPDYSAPPAAPYTAEEVRVPTPQGHTLAGTLTLPANEGRRVPAVVTITGSGPQERDESLPTVKGYRPMRQVADTLGRHGIAVLRLDDRGTGKSTGAHATATSEDFADDVRSALAYLRSRPDIDPTRLALVGHSEGGLIAPMVAATDSSLRAIVLLAGPARTGRVILQHQLRAGIERAPAYTPTQRDSALRTVDATIDSLGRAQPWVRFFLDYDPLVTARRVHVPTLILQGATDRQVTADQAEMLERAMRAGGNRQVARRIFADANHLFLQDSDGNPAAYGALPDHRVRPDVLAELVRWLGVRFR